MKVVLGGQGGDEIFGGYARYLIAYFEQCIKAAIDGTMHARQLRRHLRVDHPQPRQRCGSTSRCCRSSGATGLFEDLDARYFRLINRGAALARRDRLERARRLLALRDVPGDLPRRERGKESYFDSMTHFDFKTLLPALLHVEDRMSMAHGLESRVPLLDTHVVELAATIPADVKFKNGHLKHALKEAMSDVLPDSRSSTGATRWASRCHSPSGRRAICATSSSTSSRRPAARSRLYLDPRVDMRRLVDREARFGRTFWGLLSLELWQQEFHDRADAWRRQRVEAVAAVDR